MIPGVVSKFLETASVGIAATRDQNLRPSLHRVSGWEVEDESILRALIHESEEGKLHTNLEANGRIAVTIERIGTHETYQFKGRYLDSTAPSEHDQDVYEACRERFVAIVTELFGFSVEDSRNYVTRPNSAVRFQVEEIYLQTPGPGAGRRLVPPEETL